jgi:hypothetical protein
MKQTELEAKMNISHLCKQVTKLGFVFILLCLLVENAVSVQTVQAAPEDNIRANHGTAIDLASSGCSTIYDGRNGWVIEKCTSDPAVTTTMTVLVNGVSKGKAALIRIYHRAQNGPGTPQVAIIYASGYVRLKQNADPSPAIPFGTSFILGPAYWSGSNYYHHPRLNRLEIDTTWLPNAPLRILARATNHDFSVNYDMVLPSPRDRQTRLHVTQTYVAKANININPTRRAEHQGFKLVQASSMYINEGGTCDGGYTDCHDSDAARFIGDDLLRHQVAFTDLILPAFVFDSPFPLGSTWLDVLHSDDQSWQSQTGANTSGNTPNVRIALDELPTTRTITPQGWIAPTNDPNQDNVGLWLHDDGPASVSWKSGQRGQIGYWLLAQDDPPEPWGDLGLRPGLPLIDFEGNGYTCNTDNSPKATIKKWTTISGYTDNAVQIDYDLGTGVTNNDNWVQIRCDFSQTLDLSAYDHLRLDWRGSSTTNPDLANSLQVGLISEGNIFGTTYRHTAHHTWWDQMVIPFSHLKPWGAGTFNPASVSAFIISVKKISKENATDVDDEGGSGRIAVDNVSAFNVGSRQTPNSFETVSSNKIAAQTAANWLAKQQQDNGSLRSWAEEEEESPYHKCLAHTYDQALGLIVFSKQGMWREANKLADYLVATQNADGSWYQTRTCSGTVDNFTLWVGDIAWASYALGRYLGLGGTHPQATNKLLKGADWLAQWINPADENCLLIDNDKVSTEGTLDAWWALQAAGANYAVDANKIKGCLVNQRWNDQMGMFKGGQDDFRPYLDNQTWGAAFLRAIVETEDARRALSYARDVLRVPAQGSQLFGFDGNAGPWSVWNEGTAQYIAVGGAGARDALFELLAQQEKNGAMVGSPDEFNGGGVWTTRWHGVAPTAWLFFALTNEPFRLTSTLNSTAAHDGWILESSENSGKGSKKNITATTLLLGDDAARKQYRSILSFSTKDLPDDAVITHVILKVKKNSVAGSGDPVKDFQGFMVDAKKGFFGSALGLQANDFQAKGNKSYGPFKPTPKNGWYTIDLTPAMAYINKQDTNGGLTQLRLRFMLDDNNNAIANYISLYSGNAPVASCPQLIVEYYIP